MVKALYDGRLATNIAGLKMKTPITTASGTFGFGLEFTDFLDLEKVGAVTVKGTSLEPQMGNKDSVLLKLRQGCSTVSDLKILVWIIFWKQRCRNCVSMTYR